MKAVRAESPSSNSLEVLGVPALHMDVSDSTDPVAVGGTTTYLIRIRNTGSLAATKIDLRGEMPANLAARDAYGPRDGERGTVNGALVQFPIRDAIQPGEEVVYRVAAKAVGSGTGRFRAELRCQSQSTPIRVEELTTVRSGGSP